ncbi:MAG TPA: protein kinase [Planctomycetota bacterium]|nr:protein kinase [Planctomycetota bacterium]
MPNDAIDLALARHVRQIGLVSQEQVNAALQAQASSVKAGRTLSFSEVLVQMGLITPAQRETLEKKVKDQQAGVQQLGDFKLVRKLGEGGMGAVYLATGPDGRSVAVKVLPRHLGTNEEFVKRFRREADAAIQLKHPNIIGAFFAGVDAGYHYYVMEYCDGMPLDKLLVAQKTLPVRQAIAIALEVSRGLKYAHDLGIIHRDIKPSNIMLARDGEARVLDLGLSKNLEDSALSFKTVTGAVLGTPHYISPEQAQGERNVDGRSDIYSLGATIYHLVTGRTPFDGATALEILSKHVNTVLPNPQDLREEIPDAVVHVLERMMAKAPADRYRDCGELITDLVEAQEGRMPKSQVIAPALTSIAPAARRSPLKKRPPTGRRATAPSSPASVTLIGGGAAAAVLVLLVFFWSGHSDPPPGASSSPPPNVRPPAARTPESEKTGFDVATWEKSIADLPPEARVKSVQARLKSLNPGYDGSESEHQANHGRVMRLRLGHPSLRDISPLRALVDLRELELTKTQVSDLSPLQDSKLTLLVLDGDQVSDLRPLRTMKELSIVALSGLPLRDLAPLEGLDLARLTVKGCPVTDLSPLRRVRLRELHCDFDAKRDTEVLKSMPLLEQINGMPVEEFWRKLRATEPSLAGDPASPAAQDPLSLAIAKLKQLNPDWEGRETHSMQDGAVTELVIVALGITDLSPLSSLTSLRRLDVSGYWSTSERKEYRGPLRDLSALRGLKLQKLGFHHTAVANLGPLEGMPLEELDAGSTNIRDLSPIRGMPLKSLSIGYSAVRDIGALAGMPLSTLLMDQLEIADFSPLQKMPLRVLSAGLNPQKHASIISSIRTLERLNGFPVAEFLRAAAPSPTAPAADAALWKNSLDLIPHIDPSRDTVVGPWRKEGGHIYCDGGENAVLRIPYEPPGEYDFRIIYTRVQGRCGTAQFLTREGRNFFWEMGGYGNALSGFALIGGKGSSDNPTKSPLTLRDEQRYVSVIEVRKDRVTAFVDGKKLSEWLPSMGEFSTDRYWSVDVPGLIGLGNCESQTVFDLVQVRDVTGRGKLRTTLTSPPDPVFLKSIPAQTAPEQVRRIADKLRELNLGIDLGLMRYKIENDRITEFACSGVRLNDAWPIRGFPFLRKLELGDELIPGHFSDLGFLKGMKLQELSLLNTRVSDLGALQGMPLSRLQISGPALKDLSSLRGLKITSLSITGTSALDLTPLRDLPIQKLEIDRNLATDYSVLKSVRTLRTVNDLPVAEFLKGLKEVWSPIFDGRSTDCLRNPLGWKVDRGSLVNDPSAGVANSAQTRFEFENGDLRLRFEGRGWDGLLFRVRQSEKGSMGVLFDGVATKALEGRPHELLFICRGETVTATLDGRAVPLTDSPPVKSGCLQFNATGGTLRLLSIEYRPDP